MEIICPRCGKYAPVFDQEAFRCVHCRSELSVAEQGEGYVIVSVDGESSQNLPVQDDVTDDYTKWQVVCIFSIIFGIVISGIVGFQTYRDYRLGGLLYISKMDNLLFIGIAGVISFGLMIVGTILYRYLAGLKKNYIRRMMK